MKAGNACGQATRTLVRRVDVVPELTVLGMEVAQGAQPFLLDGGARNTLPTVANKDTIICVYVASDRNGLNDDWAEVTGWLRIDGVELAPINGSIPTNPQIIARRQADIDRQQTNHTIGSPPADPRRVRRGAHRVQTGTHRV